MQQQLDIAYYQQDILWEQPDANRHRVEQAFDSLAQKADILMVPETFTTGFSDNMADMAESTEGDTLRWAADLARKHDALFVGTWTVRDPLLGGVVNRMHWVRPDGTYGYYDKGHTFRMSSEASQLVRGAKRAIFEWRGWRIKPAICYDLRFPLWLHNSNPPEYDILLFCANWPGSRYEAWNTLLKARSIENLCYTVGVNRVGTDPAGISYTGDSAAIDFRGHVISQCQHGKESIQAATLHLQQLEDFRSHWPFYLDYDCMMV